MSKGREELQPRAASDAVWTSWNGEVRGGERVRKKLKAES
jgi:hypothetical protein